MERLREVPLTLDGVTAEFVTDALRAGGIIGTECAVASLESEQIGEGVGLMGVLARLSMSYHGDASGAPATAIVKLPSALPQNRAVGDFFRFYERESRFYEQLQPGSPVRVPACYYHHADDDTNTYLLLLEDFAGRSMVNQLDGAGIDRARVAVTAIGALHAHWWESPDLASKPWLPRAIDPVMLAAGEQYRLAWPTFIERFESVMPEGTRALGERVAESYERTACALFASLPPTLCHGDFRVDNLMFDDDAEGVDRVGFLDWQIVYRAGGIADVCYFVTQSLTAADRHAHDRELVEIWYDSVAGHLGAAPSGYTVDDAWDGYRRCAGNMTVYGVIAGASLDGSNERGRALVQELAARSFSAALDLETAALIDR